MSLEIVLTREQRGKIASLIQSEITVSHISVNESLHQDYCDPEANPQIQLWLLIGLSFVEVDLSDEQAIGILKSLQESVNYHSGRIAEVLREIEQEA